MEIIMELADKYGWIIATSIFIIYSQRERVGFAIERWFGISIKAKESEDRFENALREKALQNGDYSKELVRKLFAKAEDETAERRTKDKMLYDQTRSTEVLASKAIEVMQDFASVARSQADRNALQWKEVSSAISKLNSTMEGIGFLLAQDSIMKKQGLNFDVVSQAIGKGAQDGDIHTD